MVLFQPRVPAGQSDGGQWTSGSGGGGGDGDSDNGDDGDGDQGEEINDPPIEPVYPVETALLAVLTLSPVGRGILEVWRTFLAMRIVGNANVQWKLGEFKSATRWANQLKNRGWTPEEITETIKNGKNYAVENRVNKGNAAVQYFNPKTGRFVVRDEVTMEILQVSDRRFKLNPPITQ